MNALISVPCQPIPQSVSNSAVDVVFLYDRSGSLARSEVQVELAFIAQAMLEFALVFSDLQVIWEH